MNGQDEISLDDNTHCEVGNIHASAVVVADDGVFPVKTYVGCDGKDYRNDAIHCEYRICHPCDVVVFAVVVFVVVVFVDVADDDMITVMMWSK